MKNLKLTFLLSCLMLNACGSDGRSGFKAGDGLTGKNKIVLDADTNKRVESPYTISGFKDAFDALVKKIGANNDAGLASALSDVVITPLDAKDIKTNASPSSLVIEMKFKKTGAKAPDVLKFKAKMVSDGKGLNSVTKTDKNYQLLAYCYTKTCHRIELRLQRRTSETQTGSEIGVLVSKSNPTLKLIKPSSIAQFSERGLKQIESLVSRGVVTQNSVVIVTGASFSEITVKANLYAPPILRILADLIDTENVVTEVTSVKLEGGNNTRAKLVGNDSSTGDLMFELISGSEAAILLFEKNQSEVDLEEQVSNHKSGIQRDLSARAQPNTGLFPTSAKNTTGLAFNDDFASYAVHDRTQAFVNHYKTKESRAVKNVFAYTHNVSPYVTKIFETMALTPEFAYLLPVESGYLKGPGTFDALQIPPPTEDNPKPSAFGPWQILNKTAFDIQKRSGINFNLFKIVNRVPNLNDDRSYLLQSTLMAASYLKILSRMFSQDAGLVVMSYHSGEGSMARGLNKATTPSENRIKIENLARRNITLEHVEKYKMMRADHREYAFRFLAWREMGQNPSRHGLQNIKKINTDAYKNRLSRPNGPSPI